MRSELLAVFAAAIQLAVAPLGAEQEKSSPEDQALRRAEQITVESASKSETTIVDAPATMSVVGGETLAASPARNYADLLRGIPGMNAIQMSARDVNLTTRQATSTLNNSQLVLVDGRSVYLEFFGLVLWDFVPSPGSDEVKQIEVVRGPASVVWGANALSGVINIITRPPRERTGLGMALSAGLFGRAGGSRAAEGQGQQYGGSFSYAGALDETWSYRLGAGYFSADPYSRPVGRVPLGCHPLGAVPCRDASGKKVVGGFPTGGAEYPAESAGGGNFRNSGTSQPRFDLRVDQDDVGGGRITYEAGYAGTEGIIHTGIGPFDIEDGSYMAYGRAAYARGALRVSAFANLVDAQAPNLLQTDPVTLQPVVLGFETKTYDLELGDSRVLGGRHVLTYGGNLRHNDFSITMAPAADDRNEIGAYLQEEFFVDRFRVAAGGRADKFANIAGWVFSPRLSVMFKPRPTQSVRASYNRAFRAPSVINNFMDQSVLNPTPIDLRPLGAAAPPLAPLVPDEPFLLVVNTFGNETLREEHIDALELAYTATLGRTTLGLAVYQNDTDDNINFTSLTANPENPEGLPGLEYYSVEHPAQAIGAVSGRQIVLSPQLMGLLGVLPGTQRLPYRVAQYLNLGPVRNRGVEASLEHRFDEHWSAFGNYSWQATPRVLDPGGDQIRFPLSEVTIAPKSRVNAGVSYRGERALGSLSVSYAGRAFWNEVLTEPYWGYTDAYALVNASAGLRLAEGRLTLSLKGTNLLGRRIQQHIYGDLLRRSLVAELRLRAN